MSKLRGACLVALTEEECRRVVAWVQGGTAFPDAAADCRWLLAHCDDGVIWGKRQPPTGEWRLSSGRFAGENHSPFLREEALQQLRLFGETEEVLVWRAGGGFRGRRLRDGEPLPAGDPFTPADEEQILVGDRVLAGPDEGFTLVGDGTGSRHAVPRSVAKEELDRKPWSLRLGLKQYFEEDPESGAVRVAATRLTGLGPEEREEKK